MFPQRAAQTAGSNVVVEAAMRGAPPGHFPVVDMTLYCAGGPAEIWPAAENCHCCELAPLQDHRLMVAPAEWALLCKLRQKLAFWVSLIGPGGGSTSGAGGGDGGWRVTCPPDDEDGEEGDSGAI